MEKARETIEEIEEIKRNEMTTMMYHRQSLLNDSTNDHSSGNHFWQSISLC